MLNDSPIDITFDFRTDAGKGDPDKTSPTLRKYHKKIWSKQLPNGKPFDLESNRKDAYLYHFSDSGEFFLSSDCVIPSFRSYKRLAHIIDQIPETELDYFQYIGYTIGGFMLWPSNKINGKMTINGARGCSRKIADRFDLTIECIRKYYAGEDNPLCLDFKRYDEFFQLFNDFKGFVEFFLLQDIVNEDFSRVQIFTEFESFETSPLPSSLEEYLTYKENAIAFLKNRNKRILKSIS